MKLERKKRMKKMVPFIFYDDTHEIKDSLVVFFAVLITISLIGAIGFAVSLSQQRYEDSLSCPENTKLVDMGESYLCLEENFVPRKDT